MSKKKIHSLKFKGSDLGAGYSRLLEVEAQNQFLGEFGTESDRGLVLAVAAILDELLRGHLISHFKKGSKTLQNSLFDANGPFSSFSSKIDTLYCLGDFREDVRHDLHTIRKLRNYVAHSWSTFKFDDRIESAYLKPLKNYLEIYDEPDMKSKPAFGPDVQFDPRTKLLLTCAWYLLNLSTFVTTEKGDEKEGRERP